MTFTIPIRTRSTLNLREHWAVKAKRVKQERWATYWAATAIKSSALTRYRNRCEFGEPVTVTLVRISPRPLDDDNLRGALKGVRDEIAKLLGIDDRDPVVRWDYGQRKGKPKEHAVEVDIR